MHDGLRVFVIVDDSFLWTLSPFSYLFDKYWSPTQEVVVGGFNRPKFELPNNFKFYSIAPSNLPVDRWSNGLIKFLTDMKDDYCVLMLSDYWLSRPVDTEAIDVAYTFMKSHPDVIRFDLTGDVMHCSGDCRDAHYYGFINHYDVVEKPPGKEYRMSFQAAIWNNKLLLSLLEKNRTPWLIEINTIVPDHILVLGTKQWPVRYVNAVWKGELDLEEINNLHPTDYRLVSTTFPESMPRRRKNG